MVRDSPPLVRPVAYEDWPSLIELPACVRAWGAKGVRVEPIEGGAAGVECDWYTAALHAKVCALMHKQ